MFEKRLKYVGNDEDLWEMSQCNGPGVVQRKDRQKKEFHDQSDYR